MMRAGPGGGAHDGRPIVGIGDLPLRLFQVTADLMGPLGELLV